MLLNNYLSLTFKFKLLFFDKLKYSGMADTEDTTRIDGDLKCNGSCVSDGEWDYKVMT